MADVTKAWHSVFDKGTKKAQERLKKAHGNKPEFQAFLKSRGAEGGERSVKQASTSLKKVTDTKVAAQKIADMRFKKALQTSSERVKEMGRRRREGGEGLGGGLETARDVVAHVKKYGSIKAGRLGEETVEEANRIDLIKRAAASNRMGKSKFLSRVNARAAQLSQQKRDDKITKSTANYGMSNMPFNAEGVQMNEVSKAEAEKVLGGAVKEKPKMGPGKQPAGYRYVRNLARKAMKKGMMKEDVEVTEEIKDAADVGEYDYEGDMAKSQLRSILVNAKRMHDMLEENTNLPEWVQSKITLAQDYILTAASYMEGEMNEEFTDEELAALTEAEMSAAQMKKREKFVKSMKPVSDWEKRYPGRGEQVMYATATKMAMKEEAEEVVEETEEQLEEKYMGFKALKASIAAKGGARDPGAVAAAIGRKKYGKEKFQAMAAAGKKANEEVEQIDEKYTGKVNGTEFSYHASENQLENDDKLHKAIARQNRHLEDDEVKAIVHSGGYSKHVVVGGKKHRVEHDDNAFNEEVVTEAEGKVAVSPKEKTLAAMHGDKTKITYGDVIKARLQSAKEKALKGKE